MKASQNETEAEELRLKKLKLKKLKRKKHKLPNLKLKKLKLKKRRLKKPKLKKMFSAEKIIETVSAATEAVKSSVPKKKMSFFGGKKKT